jgi:hypothetical protein
MKRCGDESAYVGIDNAYDARAGPASDTCIIARRGPDVLLAAFSQPVAIKSEPARVKATNL